METPESEIVEKGDWQTHHMDESAIELTSWLAEIQASLY